MKGHLGVEDRTKARSQESPGTPAWCSLPSLCPRPWGPHFSQAEEESLPGAPVVEATTTTTPTPDLFPCPSSPGHVGPRVLALSTHPLQQF